MTLYDIDERLTLLESEYVDSLTGEIIQTEEEFSKLFDEIQMDIHTKISDTACFIKNLQSDCDALKAEEQRLNQRRKVKESLIERLQNNIDGYIKNRLNNPEDTESINKWKLENPRVKISYRKSDVVEITDEASIPKEYLTEKIEIKPNKTEIKKAIKNGVDVKGATVVTNLNMQIK